MSPDNEYFYSSDKGIQGYKDTKGIHRAGENIAMSGDDGKCTRATYDAALRDIFFGRMCCPVSNIYF
ncbi:hypothetical protein ACO0LO_27880 [Undibacterium sp. TJN25]|uniref:hypothetical protein n=1 Tax=Undibacterium sp. TJN25 TaxID=3413056 RepID=UPI003BF152EF